MRELDNLYSGLNPLCSNELCEGCSILAQSKPEYSYMDYESLRQGDVLFVADSFRHRYGKMSPFSKKERELLEEFYPGKSQYTASVKCPSVKEGDMIPANMNLCRKHLTATIEKVKPRLVYACGNLSMKMLVKKSGIMDKRGNSYEYVTDSGHTCIVVPIYHPYAVLKEPRHRYLFETDIRNAYEKYVLGKTNQGNFEYKVLTEIKDVEVLGEMLKDSEETVAVDIETTGLNFLTDKIQTIAISSQETNWAIPLDHKDSPFRKGMPHYGKVWSILRKILENPRNKKVFHNAKFDMKFLLEHGIAVKNVWDTKIMHHFLNETAPKGLMDLVKLYFSDELENL
jgi:uracil-DNA glycosylase family 4